LRFFASEYLFAKYPNLPADVMKSAVDAYIGRRALANVGTMFGVGNVMKWKGV
jgi:dsRNA-specific ribonuclease